MARITNTFKNFKWAFIAQLVILGIGLTMPRLIILTYGSAINGLTATIYQIISVMNLLQAGAVGASIFAMFKPAADNNYKQISLILHSSKRYFKKLGWVFLLLTFIVAPILAIKMEDNDISYIEIILAVVILGFNASFSFFFFSFYDILFSSHQRRYFLSFAGIIQSLVYYALLFTILNSKISFIFMYVAVLLGSCLKLAVLYLIYRKQYASKLLPFEEDKKINIPGRGHLLINQISTQAVESSPTLFIAFNYDFIMASVYSIYYMVFTIIKVVISIIHESVNEVFGNLVVSEDKSKVETIFNLMLFVFIIIGTFISICSAFLFMPFISLYTNGMSDVNYSVPLLALFILLYFLVYCFYIPFFTLSNVYGLYKETYKQSIVSGVMALIISYIFARYSEMFFVLIGPIFYYLSSIIYRVIIIDKIIDWSSIKKPTSRITLFIGMPLISFYLQQHFAIHVDSLYALFEISIIIAFCAIICLIIYIIFFEKSEFRELKFYIASLINGKS
jgi:O-antigen/teichoic acid export membrane protein